MWDLRTLLSEFENEAKQHNSRIPWTVTFDGGRHDRHVVFGSLVHGSETGSLPGIIAAIREIRTGKLQYGGKVSFFIGNKEAALAGKRFLEQDLNRVFTPRAPESLEKRRAAELMPLLDEAHLFVDFHQTIEPSEKPFYIFPWEKDSYLWARLLGGADALVTRKSGASFSSGTVCTDEYVRARQVPGITLEMGEKGFTELATRLTTQTITRALSAMDTLTLKGRSLEKLARRREDFTFYRTVYRHPFLNPHMMLRPNLRNFTRVEKDEVLGSSPEGDILAPLSGYLLFPKYPPRDSATGAALEPRPGEIFQIITELNANPELVLT